MSTIEHPSEELNSPESIDYHSRPELSSSEIATFIEDPIRWYHEYCTKKWTRQVTDAMELGTAIHTMIEHGGYEDLSLDIPREVLNADGHCKGKAWTDWKEANPAKVYVKPGEVNVLRQVWSNLRANSWIASHIANGEKESEHYWHDDFLNFDCRMKADLIHGPVLIDWKTTSKTNAREFAQDAVRRSYDVRLAFYRLGFRDKFGINPVVYVVAINTSGGMRVTPYRMPDAWLDDAEARLMFVVEEMANFSLESYLDSKPVDLVQPRYAIFDLESV